MVTADEPRQEVVEWIDGRIVSYAPQHDRESYEAVTRALELLVGRQYLRISSTIPACLLPRPPQQQEVPMLRASAFLVAILVLLVATEAAGQGITIVPNAGISKDMRSETANYWKMGFSAGLNAYFDLPGSLSVGGRVAYHSWGVDGDGWAEDYLKVYSAGYGLTSSSGSQSVVEIVPTLKYSLTPKISPLRLDLSLGAGLFLVSPGDVKLEGSYRTAFSSGTISITIRNESLTGFGVQVGAPLTIAGKFQVLPLYSLYWGVGDAYHHITINAGIVL